MNRIIIDIETIGPDFDELTPEDQEYLLHFAKTEEEREEAKQKIGLQPPIVEIVAIGMLNPETDQGRVYFQSPKAQLESLSEQGIEYITGSEKEILEKFWQDMRAYHQIITFNGRSFDGPILLLRSANLGIKPTRNLVPYRYDYKQHCDLLDQLTFYGATRRYKLEFYCRAFGIESPKSDMDGLKVKPYFKQGKYLEIAKYCAGDLWATKELWQKWQEHLAF